jgi:hypothetical protein
MRKAKSRAPRTKTLMPPRTVNAGRPPGDAPFTPRVRRRLTTARAPVRKDTMLMQAAEGPRVRWGVTKPKVKKR